MDKRAAGALGHAKAEASLKLVLAAKHEQAVANWKGRGQVCRFCKKPMSYEQRKNDYCSKKCQYEDNNGRRVQRCPPCPVCGGRVQHRSQIHCSSACAIKARYDKKVVEWLCGDRRGGDWRGVFKFVRKWLGEQRGECCWKCGWGEINTNTGKVPVQVHHKDGDPLNHRPENIELLCSNCHSLTKTYGGGNRGNGRAERYAKKR